MKTPVYTGEDTEYSRHSDGGGGDRKRTRSCHNCTLVTDPKTKSLYLLTKCRFTPLGEQILSELIRFCSLLILLESDHLEDEDADGRTTLSMEIGSEAISISILRFLVTPNAQRWAPVLPMQTSGFCCVGEAFPRVRPLLRNLIENRKTYGRSVFDIKSVSHFSLQLRQIFGELFARFCSTQQKKRMQIFVQRVCNCSITTKIGMCGYIFVNLINIKINTNLKICIFWDITPCSQLKVAWRALETCLPSSRSKNKPSKKPAWSREQAELFYPEDAGHMFHPKRMLTFNGLHGVISQKPKLFVAISFSDSRALKCRHGKNLCHGSWKPGWDSKSVPSYNKFTPLPRLWAG
jgi:hypothetical protein